MKIGEKIKTLRTGNRMSQKRLGELLGVSASSIQAYESGRTEPNQLVVEAIAKEFGICPEVMTPEADDSFASTFKELRFKDAIERINEYYGYTPVNTTPTIFNVNSAEQYMGALAGLLTRLNEEGLKKVDDYITLLLMDDSNLTRDACELKKRLKKCAN